MSERIKNAWVDAKVEALAEMLPAPEGFEWFWSEGSPTYGITSKLGQREKSTGGEWVLFYCDGKRDLYYKVSAYAEGVYHAQRGYALMR